MENNIIVSTAVFPLTLSLLAIAVSFAVLVSNALAAGSKTLVNGLSELFTKPVLRLLLFSLLALSMHTIFPYLSEASRSISVITVCTEPKNFVSKINIKQDVMIMGTTMKFTIFTAAEEANTTAILATKIFHKRLMKFLA